MKPRSATSLVLSALLCVCVAACSSNDSTSGSDAGNGASSGSSSGGSDAAGGSSTGASSSSSSSGSTSSTSSSSSSSSGVGSSSSGSSSGSSGSSGADSGGDARGEAGGDSSVEAGLPDQHCGTFTASGDTITDSSTGLHWHRTLYGHPTYSMATMYCMSWGGRIPTESELTNLVAPAMACSPQITWPFPPAGETVWSSTQDPQNSTFYFTVYFNGGAPVSVPSSDGNWVLCVK